jgi:hypothetical protein
MSTPDTMQNEATYSFLAAWRKNPEQMALRTRSVMHIRTNKLKDDAGRLTVVLAATDDVVLIAIHNACDREVSKLSQRSSQRVTYLTAACGRLGLDACAALE